MFNSLWYNWYDYWIWGSKENSYARLERETKLFLVPLLGLDHVWYDDHAFVIMASSVLTEMRVHLELVLRQPLSPSPFDVTLPWATSNFVLMRAYVIFT
jgi:hypothetical protein